MATMTGPAPDRLRLAAFALTTFDAVATYIIIATGAGQEVGVVMLAMMEHIGVAEALVFRQGITLLVMLHPKLPTYCVAAVTAVYGALALLHLGLYIQHIA